MSRNTSPNALIRNRYETGKRVIRKDEGRELTQREFLDVAFGNNPRTGKPYNTRTLRKWLKGERDAQKAVEHSVQDTYSFQQKVSIQGEEFGPVLVKPSGRSGLDLFTPSGRKRVRRAVRTRITSIKDTTHSPRLSDIKSTRGLKMAKARAVRKARTGTIITRRAA